MKNINDTNFAFICETQLHIFNAINFVANNIEQSKNNSDIYVYNCFSNSRAITERLKEEDLFNNVYYINKYNEKIDVLTKFRNLYRLFFPKKTIINHIDKRQEFRKKDYKFLCMYSYTMRNRNFLRSFDKADIIMIEDGIGAYFANTMKVHIDGIYKLLDKYVFFGKYNCNPKRLYVYCPQISDIEVTENIIALPKIDQNNPALSIAHRVYDYRENNEYQDKRLVYFTQPLELIKGGFIPNSEERVYKTIEKLGLKKNLIFRVHPRQTDAKIYECSRDTIGNFWEIESPYSINNNHIFVSAFSTAAFTPKYINGLEPYVIFTYKLNFSDCNNTYWKKVDKFIERFASLYDDKSKVIVPESFSELEEAIKKIV